MSICRLRFALALIHLVIIATCATGAPGPNILWVTSEDHGPEMGCYGDAFATTPHVDALAARGMIYTRVWSCAPVCAPSRTTLIAGLHATSTGGEHMRSHVAYPKGKSMFPQLLRAAGYYCSNNAKEDYNLEKPGRVWDESSRKAHWTNRAPGQPFFAVFNSEKSHESRMRARPHKPVHNPAKVRLPAYHPDTPEVRRDWAQYYDKVTEADADAGARLAELDRAGLTEDTIVFYFGDHGSGMPRSKRWPFDSGLRVPLVVFIPEKFKHLRPGDYVAGGRSDRLVSFVDFAPTLLSLAGVKPPEWMQGRAFLGQYIASTPKFLHGYRGRMDERPDLVRSVTDGRFVYVRNYMPHLIYGQHLHYMWQTPTTRIWEKLHREGMLNATQSAFWKPKPAEELYDLATDPDEVTNLAGFPAHRKVQAKLRRAMREHLLEIRDVGFIPEGERFARSNGGSPYDMARDTIGTGLRRVLDTAELASMPGEAAVPQLRRAMKSGDSAVRYWGALGLLMGGRAAVTAGAPELESALDDVCAEVAIAAAHALAAHGTPERATRSVTQLVAQAQWQNAGVFASMAALNALENLEQRPAAFAEQLAAIPTNGPAPHVRYQGYVPRLVERWRHPVAGAE